MDKLVIFRNRLSKIGINVEMVINYPWVYLYKVNGKTVTEKFYSKYAFTVAFLSVSRSGETKFTDLKLIFKTIRKYGGADGRRVKATT